MQSIDYQNEKLAFLQKGKGLPIVFIHGFCEDSRMWEPFLPQFRHFQSICIDLPGFGFSTLKKEYSIAEMAQCVNAVLEHLKIEKCILIGHSMGGYVSLEFAKQFPNKLQGLCLFHSHPFADSEEKKAGRLKGIDFIERNGHVLYVKHLIPKLFAYDYSKGYPFEVNKLIFNATKYQPDGIIAALKAMRNRADNSKVLEKINCPVSFIIGAKDLAVDYPTSLAQTHLPQLADINVLKDIGHMGMFEAPKRTAKMIKTFIRFCENR